MPLFHDSLLLNKRDVEYISTAANSGLTASNTLITSTPANIFDDYLISLSAMDETSDVISMSGWTTVSANTTVSSAIFRLTSNGNLAATTTVNFTTGAPSTRDKAIMINCFRGVRNLTVGTIGGGKVSSLVASSITMPFDGILLACYLWRNNGGAPAISSAPSGMIVINTRSQGDVGLAAYYQRVTSGSTGSKTLTLANTADTQSILLGLT